MRKKSVAKDDGENAARETEAAFPARERIHDNKTTIFIRLI